MSDLISQAFGMGDQPAPAEKPKKKKQDESLDSFTAAMAQASYQNQVPAGGAGAPPPAKGGTADALGTGGAWGKPK